MYIKLKEKGKGAIRLFFKVIYRSDNLKLNLYNDALLK